MQASGGLAVISGGGSGVGREIALELSRRGFSLALIGRREGPLVATLGATGLPPQRALALPCDVTDEAAVTAACALIEERFGAADVVVPAAGIVRLGRISQLPAGQFAETIAVNLTGVYNLIHGVLPSMLRRGRGWLFPILSVAARQAFPEWGAYAASKWGLAGLVAALRAELASTGIRITAVYPGATDTPIWDGLHGSWNRAAMVPAAAVATLIGAALDADPRALVEEIHVGPVGGAL
jgi:NAD(P)-dependent dehydrogenase (short-subunit alcohol dehydrogenase family)